MVRATGRSVRDPSGLGGRPFLRPLGLRLDLLARLRRESRQAGRPGWVDEEIEFLRNAIGADVPVLGLCFGGQALACAAGGGVAPAEPAEVGWLPIESSVGDLIPSGPWLHFHYDQLRRPEGATELAQSRAGTAAFRVGRSLGLQFHPEATPAIADQWARVEVRELAKLGITPEQVAEEGIARGDEAAAAAEQLFDAWWDTLEG